MTSTMFLLLVLSLGPLASDGQIVEYVKGVRITREQNQCTSGSQIECADCNTRRICDRLQNVIGTIKCPAASPTCVNGLCTVGGACTATGSSDACPAPGFFPNPTICQRYTYCDVGLNAVEYVCPQRYVYDPSTNVCKLLRSGRDCPQINCQANRNRFVSYALDPRIYFFCTSAGLPYTLQCEKGYALEQNLQSCVFQCSEEGRFPITGDGTRYYLCLSDGRGGFLRFEQQCPPGYTFVTSRCLSPSDIQAASSTPATSPSEAASTSAAASTSTVNPSPPSTATTEVSALPSSTSSF